MANVNGTDRNSGNLNKQPQAVFDQIFAFPPNRDTLGGTAYFIVENRGNILVDCPAWHSENQQFIQNHGGVQWLCITHRGGMGRVKELQAAFNCQVIVQEQEAYLLPGLKITAFQAELILNDQTQLIWTPGHSPGSNCLYFAAEGGILFTGRHLLPDAQGQPMPLKTAKTFHWRRQLQSVQRLRDRFNHETLNHLCPGANTGLLRGERQIADAYTKLATLDLATLETPVLTP